MKHRSASGTALFQDRTDAGRQLAAKLRAMALPHPVVLALPRGGVPVAAEIATALAAPLDLVIVRKIGLPFQPELALGAVAEGDPPAIVRNEDVLRLSGTSAASFEAGLRAETAEIRRRRDRYLGNRPHVPLAGRTALVVDDGIATGATMRAALAAVRQQHPARIVLAVPVMARDRIAAFQSAADDLVTLAAPKDFTSVGGFYRDFRQVDDDEVIRLLGKISFSD